LDLKSLILLVDILDAGNLSEAARRLKMTRANVSYHLGQLERSIGSQLVRRTTRRLEPTEIGIKLYQHGRSIQNELVAAQESVQSLGNLPKGKVRLSVPSGYGLTVMTPWLLDFKHQYPGIVLDVLFENSVEDLLRNEIDIAVRIVPSPPQNLVARALGQVRYLVCASPAYVAKHGVPEHPSELSKLPVISASVVGRPLRLSVYRGDEACEHVQLEPTIISRNYSFLHEATRSGLGLGILPDYTAHADLVRGELIQTLAPWNFSIFGRGMYLLYMQNRTQTRSIRLMIDFIIERAKKTLGHTPGLMPIPYPATP